MSSFKFDYCSKCANFYFTYKFNIISEEWEPLSGKKVCPECGSITKETTGIEVVLTYKPEGG